MIKWGSNELNKIEKDSLMLDLSELLTCYIHVESLKKGEIACRVFQNELAMGHFYTEKCVDKCFKENNVKIFVSSFLVLPHLNQCMWNVFHNLNLS